MARSKPRGRRGLAGAPLSAEEHPGGTSPLRALFDGLVGRGLQAAERVFTQGVQAELGEAGRKFSERVARRMADRELGEGKFDKLANSAREIWISRAAEAIDACLSELGTTAREVSQRARAPRRG